MPDLNLTRPRRVSSPSPGSSRLSGGKVSGGKRGAAHSLLECSVRVAVESRSRVTRLLGAVAQIPQGADHVLFDLFHGSIRLSAPLRRSRAFLDHAPSPFAAHELASRPNSARSIGSRLSTTTSALMKRWGRKSLPLSIGRRFAPTPAAFPRRSTRRTSRPGWPIRTTDLVRHHSVIREHLPDWGAGRTRTVRGRPLARALWLGPDRRARPQTRIRASCAAVRTTHPAPRRLIHTAPTTLSALKSVTHVPGLFCYPSSRLHLCVLLLFDRHQPFGVALAPRRVRDNLRVMSSARQPSLEAPNRAALEEPELCSAGVEIGGGGVV
jgi:hypothetical protein